jgi:eukaryotic-like serine/threonine-protein kinase
MSLSSGTRLADRYILIDRIGVGGMGEVWRGADEVLGRVVAVKALALPLAADPLLRAAVHREARAAAGLAHPHVTQVYDYGETAAPDGTPVPYVVMEFVQGQNLAVRLQTGALPWAQAVRVGAEVAAALAAAHSVGVVHRDIKPGNVMLTSRGAKVLDFGIATLTGRHVDANLLMGAQTYTAPERLGDDRADPAGDVYSLGALMYECLIGQPPQRIDEWNDAAATGAAQVPPLQVPGLSAEVAAVIDQCLSLDPVRRPSSAQLAWTLAADVPTTVMPVHGDAAAPYPTMVQPVPIEAHLAAAPADTAPGRHRLVAVLAMVAAAGLVVFLIAASAAGQRIRDVAKQSHGAPMLSPTQMQTASAGHPPTDPAGILAALQASIDAGVVAGEIDAGAVRDLRKMLQEQGVENANEILDKIDQLARDGRIDPQRADWLRIQLRPLLPT